MEEHSPAAEQMEELQLPPAAAKLVNWQRVQEALSRFKGYVASDAASSKPPPTAAQQSIIDAFDQARMALREDSEKIDGYKRKWLNLGYAAAVLSLIAAVLSAALQNDWGWAAFGGVLLGEGGLVTCCFKFLSYLKGEEAINRLLASAQVVFHLSRTDEQYDAAMKWFIDRVTKLQ